MRAVAAVNETVTLEMADALVSTGLSKLGFRYVNIDAGAILRSRDSATGKLVVVSTAACKHLFSLGCA